MNPILLLGLASGAGALVFLAAGYLLGSSRDRGESAESAEELTESTEPTGASSSLPGAFATVGFAADSLESVLQRAARESQATDALVFDDEGLAVGFAVQPPEASLGAQVGVLAKSLTAAGLGDALAPAELQLVASGGAKVRCRRIDCGSLGTLWLTTVGARARTSVATERAVSAAVQGTIGATAARRAA